MSDAHDSGEPGYVPTDPAAISEAAERARQRLHEEIERVRIGVEEMLSEQEKGGDPDLRRELDALREETRRYVKRRVRKSEKRLALSVRKIDGRLGTVEQHLERFEQDRKQAEWRIHTNTERMLNGLLQEVRAIADRLTNSKLDS
ncbi:MAG: hypothetical protein WBM00_08955 [Solirubrobacterales bacterium]